MTVHTTDTTPAGQRIARNAMRIRLWADPVFAHRWLCHPERECEDGCDDAPIPERLELYGSPPEGDLPPDTFIWGTDHCPHRVSIGSHCSICDAVVSYDGEMDILGS